MREECSPLKLNGLLWSLRLKKRFWYAMTLTALGHLYLLFEAHALLMATVPIELTQNYNAHCIISCEKTYQCGLDVL